MTIDADRGLLEALLPVVLAAGRIEMNYRVVVSGKPEDSELYRRLTTDDEEEHMPPADGGKRLSQAEIELIRRWIEQGAEYEAHWSFIPLARPAIPKVASTDWPRNAIDRFVLARLEREALGPAAEADLATLLRRVSLDLTGLPPTLKELDAFLADNSPRAYETAVEAVAGVSAIRRAHGSLLARRSPLCRYQRILHR